MPLPALLLVGLLAAHPASERGTPEQAKAMLDQAVAHYAQVGRKQALADFNAKRAPFGQADLYVFCIDHAGNTSANGGFPSYVGKPIATLVDADGKPLGQRLVDAATGDGDTAVDYPWPNPLTHVKEAKVSWVRKLADDVCGVGAYRAGAASNAP